MDIIREKTREFDKDLKKIPLMVMIEEKTGVKSTYLVMGFLGLMFVLVFLGFMSSFLTDLVGVLYPAYKSLKSLKSREEDDDKQWLTYWVVYALVIVIDTYSGFILSYIPHYFTFKFVVIVWLMSPITRGALTIYNSILRSLFLRYKDSIQGYVNQIGSTAEEVKDDLAQEALKPENVAKAVGKVNEATDYLSAHAGYEKKE